MTQPVYGCHNRPPFLPIVQMEKAGQVAQWPFAMSPNCQYTYTDLGRADPRCEGCKHKLPGLIANQQTEGAQA